MQTFDELQHTINEYGVKINAPQSWLYIHRGPQGDGSPYVMINITSYSYIIEERGLELERRTTEDFDLLCYWLMKDIVFRLAWDYVRQHRIHSQDVRRIVFQKEIELMEKLNLNWSWVVESEIREILECAPYTDNHT